MLSKKYAIFLISIVVGYGLLFLLQLWFGLFESAVFVKISVTFFIVGIVAGLVLAIFRDVGDEDKNKKKKLVD